MPAKEGFLFVTTPHLDPWSGAEELWSQTATSLASEGYPVAASIWQGALKHPKILELPARGVELWPRPRWYSLRRNPWAWFRSRRNGPLAFAIERIITARSPALVCFSDGGTFPPLELLELCVSKCIPFVTIEHANNEFVWYTDQLAERHRSALSQALRCFFVSETNRALAQKQIGGEIHNSEVVRNPFSVAYDNSMPWPAPQENGEIRFATVGRLWPPSKGQDLLLEALAGPAWRGRQWRLSIYGEGPVLHGLEQLTRGLGLADRVVFAGFSTVEKIWAANHVLVMPSRYEGLPIAMVEAMLCARPVIATNVAGHGEIVEDGVTGFLADAPTARSIAVALERFWARRQEAEFFGKTAAIKIRQLVTAEPVRLFSGKLKRLAGV